MNKVDYRPKIQVLHVEDDKNFYKPLFEELTSRGIYVHHVNNLNDALEIVKSCQVDLIVSDGSFPTKEGGKVEKQFLNLVANLKKIKKTIPIIPWANSTHVHEYCKNNNIESCSKIEVTRHMFERRGREYFPVSIKTATEVADIIEQKLLDRSEFDKTVLGYSFGEYYKEPVTVFGAFLAFDMRTQMFKDTAGRNYGPLLAEIDNGTFTIFIDFDDDKKVANSIYKKITKQNFFPTIKREVFKRAKRLQDFSQSLRKRNFKSYSNAKLAETYLEFSKIFMQMRTYTSLPTAMEHESNTWTGFLKQKLNKKIKDETELNRILSTLTTPSDLSYLNLYELDVAKLGLKKFSGKSIVEDTKTLVKKWAFISYTFSGTPLTVSDVNKKIKVLGKKKEDFEKFLKESKDRLSSLEKEKKQIVSKYKLTKEEMKWCQIGADIVYIKYFRKGIFAESYYSVEFLLEEIGKRIKCQRKHVANMFGYEVLAALKTGVFPKSVVEERVKDSVLLTDAKLSQCFRSKVVKGKYKIREEDYSESEMLKRQIAYKGNVTGKVTIVNVIEDMKKMNDGDVLVSRSTNPSLLPAMRQSSAFVTDAGGLTCHAAIVAREMKKPCVVGTKNATKLLKDGMKVEVDADNGIVRIL